MRASAAARRLAMSVLRKIVSLRYAEIVTDRYTMADIVHTPQLSAMLSSEMLGGRKSSTITDERLLALHEFCRPTIYARSTDAQQVKLLPRVLFCRVPEQTSGSE